MRWMTEQEAPVARATLGDFAEALASERATPGGGAAAAVAAALAASLTAMVVRLSMDRPKYALHAALHAEALPASDDGRRRFLGLADADAAAYAAYLAARSQRHDTDALEADRAAATKAAAREAVTVPLAIVQACHAQIDLVERLAGRTNANVSSDLEVAALLLESSARGAAANVIVNLPAVGDEGYASAVTAELAQRLQQIQGSADRTRERVAKGSVRKPEES
jgi:formiminotetrahydrofolate cyclodeaminase